MNFTSKKILAILPLAAAVSMASPVLAEEPTCVPEGKVAIHGKKTAKWHKKRSSIHGVTKAAGHKRRRSKKHVCFTSRPAPKIGQEMKLEKIEKPKSIKQ